MALRKTPFRVSMMLGARMFFHAYRSLFVTSLRHTPAPTELRNTAQGQPSLSEATLGNQTSVRKANPQYRHRTRPPAASAKSSAAPGDCRSLQNPRSIPLPDRPACQPSNRPSLTTIAASQAIRARTRLPASSRQSQRPGQRPRRTPKRIP